MGHISRDALNGLMPAADRDAFFKSMNENYFGHHPVERIARNMSHPSPFDCAPAAPVNPYTASAAPSSLNFNPRAPAAPSPFPPTSHTPNSDDMHFERREDVQQPEPVGNPFECSNMELVKKMISSWIPEEELRKQSQMAVAKEN